MKELRIEVDDEFYDKLVEICGHYQYDTIEYFSKCAIRQKMEILINCVNNIQPLQGEQKKHKDER